MDTSAAINEPAGSVRAEVAEDSHHDVAFDAARAFLGPRASYYDECWRVMGWRGTKVAWNAAAAVWGPFWFAYRRMPALTAAYLVWLALLVDLYQKGTPLPLLLVPQAGVMITTGLYANALYLHRFSRLCRRLAHRRLDPLVTEQRLITQGGVSRPAVAMTIVALIALITLLHATSGGI